MKGEETRCCRCGTKGPVEHHHIVARIDGGSDDEENLEDLCRPCRRFETRRQGVAALLCHVEADGQADRIEVVSHRLAVLEALNSPELIRQRGTYLSYWTDWRTRRLPRRVPTAADVALHRLIQKNMDEFLNNRGLTSSRPHLEEEG